MAAEEKKARLVVLYQEMYDHTKDECANNCPLPHSCCGDIFCDVTIRHAKVDWGIELKPTGHPTLPLMGPNGCIAAPHLRPICTVHTCAIAKFGYKPKMPWRNRRIDDEELDEEAEEWTKKYFKLRDELNRLELEKMIE